MSKKFKQGFKEKIASNRNKPLPTKEKIIEDVTKIYINDLIIKVDKRKNNLSYYELRDMLEEIILIKKKIVVDEVMNLSNVCDVMFNLQFKGSKINLDNKKELLFSVC